MPDLVEPLVFPPRSGIHQLVALHAVDGDTIRFGWLVEDTARLYGINAPEVHGPDAEHGIAAKEYLNSILPVGLLLIAKVLGRDKYGRALLDLYTPDGKSVSRQMIDSGHAWGWDGRGVKPAEKPAGSSPSETTKP